ncbi:hypothetical protein POM88_017819 [Heracleum sosnowskyi]|uniref:DUF5637 domain-containing protein n=1 Tax=Heracleum sosnowskyi TaxID=360622 RepID=A0AAD8MYI4_9APIA|nr:hypothetical protein POM88_017819 [Heracleum sosnowskyi]
METKKFFMAFLALVLITTMASLASAETSSVETARSSEMIIRGADGLEYYNKSPLSTKFLPEKNDPVANCLPSGGWCFASPKDCCGNCGCLYPIGVCFGTGC